MAITWLRYDWKEQPTLETISKALEPHGLIVKEFDNGDEYEFAICTPDATDEQIIDTIIGDFDSDEDDLRASLLDMLQPLDNGGRIEKG